MNKKVIFFTHHFVDEFVVKNFENLKQLNSTWDVVPIGFIGYNLLPNSLVVDRRKYPTNKELCNHVNYSEEWCSPDLFFYDGYEQLRNYEGYFIYEYDTICNISIDSFFDTNVDFFGNNIENPGSEDWMWIQLYRKYNVYHTIHKSIYSYGQSTCIYFSNELLRKCYFEIISNPHIYCNMLSEIRGGTIVKKFTDLKRSRKDIKEYIYWNEDLLNLDKNIYFFHPVKRFL